MGILKSGLFPRCQKGSRCRKFAQARASSEILRWSSVPPLVYSSRSNPVKFYSSENRSRDLRVTILVINKYCSPSRFCLGKKTVQISGSSLYSYSRFRKQSKWVECSEKVKLFRQGATQNKSTFRCNFSRRVSLIIPCLDDVNKLTISCIR